MAKTRNAGGRPGNGRKEGSAKGAVPVADAPAHAPEIPPADAPPAPHAEQGPPPDSRERFPAEPPVVSEDPGLADDPSHDFKLFSGFLPDKEAGGPPVESAVEPAILAPPAPPSAPTEPAIVFPAEAELDGTGGGEAEEAATDLLCFTIADEEYAIDIHRVWEIIRPRPATEIPGVPEFISGIISLRGEIVPIVDLRLRLGFPSAEMAYAGAKIVVAVYEGRRIGMAVDAVSHKIRVPVSQVTPPPVLLGAQESGFLTGVCRHQGRLITIMNADAVLGFQIGAGGSEERRAVGGAP